MRTGRSVCVVTTTRADYGILYPLISRLERDDTIDLRLAVSGTHLLKSYGMTVSEIERDGFSIDAAIPAMDEGSVGEDEISHVISKTVEGFSAYFRERRPELLVVLGDRYEMLGVCVAAVCERIPVAHLHGGEATEGLMDECFRHCITKMSYLHFTATEVYRKRVIQLGENPARVFNVGALGVENVRSVDLISPRELEASLGFPLFKKPCAVVTFHPVTLEDNTAERQIGQLLEAIAYREDINFLITKSNADIGGDAINRRLDMFAKEHSHCCVVDSLGRVRYMSALKYASFVLGNSSSGILEAPSFGIPTVNIGDRQRGRIQAESVINCRPERDEILAAIETAYSSAFREKAAHTVNPYGDGRTSERICEIIGNILSRGNIDLKKRFYDIPFSDSTEMRCKDGKDSGGWPRFDGHAPGQAAAEAQAGNTNLRC